MPRHPATPRTSLLGDAAACERSVKRRRLSGTTRALATGLVWLSIGGCISTHEPAPSAQAIRIGALLPFSGARAASGVPLEAALRLAIDHVNEAGGLAGRPLWLDIGDSHSDDTRGTANAIDLIEKNSPRFFIGTEEPKIAYQISSVVKAHQMVHLMPGLTSAQFHDPSASAAWFRLSPAATFIACSLAKRVINDGVIKASVVVDPDDYSGTFAVNFGTLWTSRGYTLLPTVLVDPRSQSYADVFDTLLRMGPDAVVLMTSPSVAAGLLQEWAARGKPIKLYLGPTLKDPELLRNVPTGILEGVNGVSADLGARAPEFASYFEAHTGIEAVAGSHYYYDAVALLSLAVAEGLALNGDVPTPAMLKDHMLNVSSATGTVVAFDQLKEGLALLAAGQKISYSGAAGSYVLNVLGDSILNRGAIWQISGSDFVTIDYQQCDTSELRNGGW
jgi:ABC-type branched-subunit amino acid transport system substrate-binding protein